MTSVHADKTAEMFRALADPLREQIVRLLAREALCTCHLVAETGAGQTNVSNHLRQLRAAGLVSTEASGRYTYYRLRADALRALAATLTTLADAAEEHPHSRRPCP